MKLSTLFQGMLFFLVFLPLVSPLDIFENMLEPYLKESIPSIFLSNNETRFINLNNYYGGSQLTFQFNAFTDPYISLSYNQGITNSTTKSISDRPIEFIIFPDETGLNVTGAILTDDNKIYSMLITDIGKTESDLSFVSFLKLPDDLNCRRMAKIDSMSLILDCDSISSNLKSSNETNPPQFVVVNFSMNNSLKNVNPNIIRINNTYNCGNNTEQYKNCSRIIKYKNNFVYRYGQKSRGSACGSLEIFTLNLQNNSAKLFNQITNVTNSSQLIIQDLEIYDAQDLFILDYHLGLFEVVFDENSYQVIENKCPSILGGNYYVLNFDCFDKTGIHDDFQECKLIITSSHYITELVYSKSSVCRCCFSSRKNLGENIQTVYKTFVSSNFITVYFSETDPSKNNSLNVYDRNDMNTNILYQLTNLSADSTVRLVTFKSDFYFSPNILNKLIVFSKLEKQLYLINIGQNIVSFACCNSWPLPDYLHTAFIDYQVYDMYSQVKRQDRIYVKIVGFNDPTVFSEYNTNTFFFKISFLSFIAPLYNFLRGPAQQYSIQYQNDNDKDNDMLLYVRESRSFYMPNITLPDDIIYLKIINIDLNDFFFIQTSNLSMIIFRCIFGDQEAIESQASCWNINHEIFLESQVNQVLSKENSILIQTKNNSLYSYTFSETLKYLKFDEIYKVGEKPLNCPNLLFNIISSHSLCFEITPSNDFQVSIFVPTQTSQASSSLVQSFIFSNECRNENFSYFDQTLLSSDIILAKGAKCIHILKLTYTENNSSNSLNTIQIIENEFTNVTDDFNGFWFNVVRSAVHQKINLIITNYETNTIAEFSLDDLASPIFMRKYPLFHYSLKNDTFITIINDNYLMAGCSDNEDPNQSDIFYLIYDLFESTESSLIKILQTNNQSRLYVLLDRNRPNVPTSLFELEEIKFLTLDLSERNKSLFNQFKPAALIGFLNLSNSNIQKNITLNESTRSYDPTSTWDENANFTLEVTIANPFLSNKTQNLICTVQFDYSSTIISYSPLFIQTPDSNLSIIDLSEVETTNLPQFYNGPVINYELSNDKPDTSHFEFRTYVEFSFQWNLNDKIKDFNTKSGKSFSLSDESILNLMVIPTDEFLFVLNGFNVYMLNLSSMESADKFSMIDVYNLSRLNADLRNCKSFEADYNNMSNKNIYVSCMNSVSEPFLYVLVYSDNGFESEAHELLGPIKGKGMVSNVLSMKVMDNFIFIIDQDSQSKSDCSIFILQLDLPIIPNSNGITNLYILNAQSFNVDYLNIQNFELNFFGVLNDSYVYGIILNDQTALYYCEISMNPQKKIPSSDLSTQPVSDFVLQSNDDLAKLDLRDLLSLSFRNEQNSVDIKTYWIDSNIFGEIYILIATSYELIEIKTSRFYFSDYYEISQDFQEYWECLNTLKINTRAALNPKFLVFPCVLTPSVSRKPQKIETHLKLFLKYNFTSNSSMIPISQMLVFPSSELNDFFMVWDDKMNKLFVLNDSYINEYDLSDSLILERMMLKRNIPGHENQMLALLARNNLSTAKNDWASFYGLIVAPLIFCFVGIVVLFAVITYSRKKRKGMLMKMK